MSAAGSPGASRVRKNTIAATMNITTRRPPNLLAKRLAMAPPKSILRRGGPVRRQAERCSTRRHGQAREPSSREVDVPEGRPRHRLEALHLVRGARQRGEISDANVRHLVGHDLLHLAPKGAALDGVRLA